MPPGKNMDDKLTMFSDGLWTVKRKLSVEGQYRFKQEFLPLLHRSKAEVLGSLDDDSWYLVYIGSKPESRGKGYARRLIQHVTTQVSGMRIGTRLMHERCDTYNVLMTAVNK